MTDSLRFSSFYKSVIIGLITLIQVEIVYGVVDCTIPVNGGCNSDVSCVNYDYNSAGSVCVDCTAVSAGSC